MTSDVKDNRKWFFFFKEFIIEGINEVKTEHL